MEKIDHTQTSVLLIAVSEYPEGKGITPIPNVLANIRLLKSSLINSELVGIPETNIVTSINETRGQMERKLKRIEELTRDRKSTLLVYYSGHGILSSLDFKLYLATHLTNRDELEIEGLHIDIFKGYIRRSHAGRKIVILDCCHSGAIHEGQMGDMKSKIQADINDFAGTYVMTSAAEDAFALFPRERPGQPTYFTGKLIEVLNDGLENENEFCSLREIYDRIEYDLKNQGLPLPQQSNFNRADQLLFCKNKKKSGKFHVDPDPQHEVEIISEAPFGSRTAELNIQKLKVGVVLAIMLISFVILFIWLFYSFRPH